MTTNGRRKKPPGGKTVLFIVPRPTAMFLDILCRYVEGGKQDMYDRIWEAGIQSLFGITQEELADCQMASIPLGVEPPCDDMRKMTNLICGE